MSARRGGDDHRGHVDEAAGQQEVVAGDENGDRAATPGVVEGGREVVARADDRLRLVAEGQVDDRCASIGRPPHALGDIGLSALGLAPGSPSASPPSGLHTFARIDAEDAGAGRDAGDALAVVGGRGHDPGDGAGVPGVVGAGTSTHLPGTSSCPTQPTIELAGEVGHVDAGIDDGDALEAGLVDHAVGAPTAVRPHWRENPGR